MSNAKWHVQNSVMNCAHFTCHKTQLMIPTSQRNYLPYEGTFTRGPKSENPSVTIKQESAAIICNDLNDVKSLTIKLNMYDARTARLLLHI